MTFINAVHGLTGCSSKPQVSDEALKTLRQRKMHSRPEKEANILHGDKVQKKMVYPWTEKPDSVTKEGTIIYRVGEKCYP